MKTGDQIRSEMIPESHDGCNACDIRSQDDPDPGKVSLKRTAVVQDVPVGHNDQSKNDLENPKCAQSATAEKDGHIKEGTKHFRVWMRHVNQGWNEQA